MDVLKEVLPKLECASDPEGGGGGGCSLQHKRAKPIPRVSNSADLGEV